MKRWRIIGGGLLLAAIALFFGARILGHAAPKNSLETKTRTAVLEQAERQKSQDAAQELFPAGADVCPYCGCPSPGSGSAPPAASAGPSGGCASAERSPRCTGSAHPNPAAPPTRRAAVPPDSAPHGPGGRSSQAAPVSPAPPGASAPSSG